MPGPAVLKNKALTLVCVFLLIGQTAKADDPTPEQLDFFEKNIRPVLVENCFKCHSAEEKQRANLVVDSREGMLKGGENGPAIVPGHPEKSRLFNAITYIDPKLQMPKKGKLAQQHIDDFAKWIKMGAPWPKTDKVAKKINADKFDLKERSKFWSFQPMKRPALPQVKGKSWTASPIDYFILHKLEQNGLKPNPKADKNTLLRRVYFDLIGLPPTLEEIDAFLKDDSPKAFEKVVDKLLASPHYGERWGRHWLDLVRFAETSGHEFDFELPEAYLYRDYVIRAFNDDIPYDQLVLEHIAGDLLPKPRQHKTENFNESMLGTGFWFLGESKHSPVDVLGDAADRWDNQIDVFSKTFLGLTMACARCHDHKFDPITTKDYYALMGYLQSARYQRGFIDDPAMFAKPIAKLQELRGQMTKLAVPGVAAMLREKSSQLASFLSSTPASEKQSKWQEQVKASAKNDPKNPLHPWAVLASAKMSTPEQFVAQRKDLHKKLAALGQNDNYQTFADFRQGNFDNWYVTGQAFGTGPSQPGAVQVQASGKHPIQRLIDPGVAHSGLISDRLQGAIRSPTFTIKKKYIHYLVRGREARIRLIIDSFQQIRNPIYGGLEFGIGHGDTPRWHTMDVSMWPGHRAYVEALDDGNGFVGLDRVVFSDQPQPPAEGVNPLVLNLLSDEQVTSLNILGQKYQQLFGEIVEQWQGGSFGWNGSSADRVALLNWLLTNPLAQGIPATIAEKNELQEKLAALRKEYQQVEAQLTPPKRAMAMAEGNPINEKVFIRGNHNSKGEEVPRRFLEVFVGDKGMPGKDGRLDLAKQIINPENPLTTRVMVNRLWKHHFGQGIVRSVDNFGALGELPSHPELLDWLATEFIQQGWSIKKMHRLMVLSATYQMSSQPQEAANKLDPENKLLHKMSVQRLEGEIIRDHLLTVSGQLDKKMFGPGVLPYLTPHMIGRGRPGSSGPLDGAGRRSIYINVRRNFLTPMFLVFDYPVPFTTIGKRSVSNVPAQALTMLNNPFVLQQTKLWSQKVLDESGLTPPQRIDKMFLVALGRPPSAAERQQMLGFVQEQSQMYGQPDDPRAWQDLCHVIVNLKEFIYVH